MEEENPNPQTGFEVHGANGRRTYRARALEIAQRRGVPLATIATSVIVAVAIADVDALVVVVGWVLRSLLLEAIVALFIAVLLSPLVRFLVRHGWRRGWATTMIFLAGLITFGAIVTAFASPLVSGIQHLAHSLPALVRHAENGKGPLGRFLVRIHLTHWVRQNAPHALASIAKSLRPAKALSVGSAALSTLVRLVTIAMLTLFLLLEGPILRSSFLSFFAPQTALRVARVYRDATNAVTGYVAGNLATSIIAGVVVGVSLSILGVPYAILLGTWVGLIDLLPLVGGLLAGIPVVTIAAFHSLNALIVMVVVFLAYQQIENHILNPLIMSRTMRLSPLAILISVLFGADLGGWVGAGLGSFVGALIGIPVGATIQLMIREIRKGPTAEEAAQDPNSQPPPA